MVTVSTIPSSPHQEGGALGAGAVFVSSNTCHAVKSHLESIFAAVRQPDLTILRSAGDKHIAFIDRSPILPHVVRAIATILPDGNECTGSYRVAVTSVVMFAAPQ